MRLDSPCYIFFSTYQISWKSLTFNFVCGLNRLWWLTTVCMAAVCYVATTQKKLIYSWMVIDSVSHWNCIICMNICEQLPVLLTLSIFFFSFWKYIIGHFMKHRHKKFLSDFFFFYVEHFYRKVFFLWYLFFIFWYLIIVNVVRNFYHFSFGESLINDVSFSPFSYQVELNFKWIKCKIVRSEFWYIILPNRTLLDQKQGRVNLISIWISIKNIFSIIYKRSFSTIIKFKLINPN